MPFSSLFERARANRPSIVFIDEIDADLKALCQEAGLAAMSRDETASVTHDDLGEGIARLRHGAPAPSSFVSAHGPMQDAAGGDEVMKPLCSVSGAHRSG